MAVATTKKVASSDNEKQTYVKQSDLPRMTLEEALPVAQALADNFAARSAAPHQLALAMDLSPTSSHWRTLTGAALAYGLTDAAYSANAIGLTDLGKRIAAPTDEGQDAAAKTEAALRPAIARKFFERYNRAKLPQDKIARNVLQEMGVPSDRLDEGLEILKANGAFVGIIQQTKTGPFVAVDSTRVPPETGLLSAESGSEGPSAGAAVLPIREALLTPIQPAPREGAANNRVFIAHGRGKEVVGQLKDLLAFGKFVPVVAEEHETAAKPVPEKVLDEMRGCFAGVLHVASEDELLDKDGHVHHRLNENVLIEIGAGLALYGHNLILLVQKGVHLPTNLQGLYVCYYEGEKLDYEATMKLLKAFSEFRPK